MVTLCNPPAFMKTRSSYTSFMGNLTNYLPWLNLFFLKLTMCAELVAPSSCGIRMAFHSRAEFSAASSALPS